MKPSTIQLLKDKPEECKEIAYRFMVFYEDNQFKSNELGASIWERFVDQETTPDWEILSFKHTEGTIFKLFPNGNYGSQDEGNWSLWNMLNDDRYGSVSNGQIYIHSVRRSDGEVFEEDHWVSWLSGAHKGKITAFELDNDNTMNAIVEGKLFPLKIALFNLTKLKPIFKTEDGVEVYEGDKYYWVCKDGKGKNQNIIEVLADVAPINEDLLYFSTRSAAEQWVEDHRPSVSIAQIREFAEKDLPFQTVEALLLHLKSKK